MTPVLEVEGLRTEFHLKSANVVAVDDVSFHVDGGECVGVVGESGCGKTTIGLSVMKLLPNVGHVVGGSIKLLGRDLAPLGEKEMCTVRGNEVGMVFQDPLTSLNPTMNIGDQIAESVRLHQGASKKEGRSRALEVLKMVEMPNPSGRLDAYAHELSGGLRQRVMIAMALVCTPKLLIADEPTTALDVTIQAQILDLLDRLRRDLDMSVILITHDMGVIAERADRVLVMYAGRIDEGASTTELFTRMRHPYSEALLASVAKLDQDPSVRLVSISGLPPDLSKPIDHCRFVARCRYAQPDCRESEPELLQAEDSEQHHVARCFHQVGVDPLTIANRPEAVAKAADLNVKVDEVALARQQVRADSLDRAPCWSRSTTSSRNSSSRRGPWCSAGWDRSRPSRTCPSRFAPARPSASLASPVVARRRSAAWWLRSSPRPRARCASGTRTSSGSQGRRCGGGGATCR